MADTPFTTFAYATSAGSVARTTPSRFDDIINVKDFGATGDGSTDDTTAIQLALTAAFGAYNGTPNNDANSALNKPVFFPAGEYKTSHTLYIAGVTGMRIFGAGPAATQISFSNVNNEGNYFVSRTTVTAVSDNGSGLIRLTVSSISGLSNGQSKVVGNIGRITKTGATFGEGDTTITGLNNTTGVQVGMKVYNTRINPAAKVATVSSNSITISGGLCLGTAAGGSTNITFGSDANGGWTITNVSGSHVDLSGSTYSATSTAATDFTNAFLGDTGSEINPAFMLIGVNQGIFEGIGIGCGDFKDTVGFYIHTDATKINQYCTGIHFRSCAATGFAVGALGGYGGDGSACDNMVFESCVFTTCTLAGVRSFGQNCLNWTIIGGGGSSCGESSTGIFGNNGALYSMPLVPFTLISPQMSGNTCDISCPQGDTSITGGSSESQTCLRVGGQAFLAAFEYRYAPTGSETHTFMDLTGGGKVHASSCGYYPSSDNSHGVIAVLDNSGQIRLDNLLVASGGTNGKITGSAGSKIKMSLCTSTGTILDIVSAYTGSILEVDLDHTVSAIPTAATKFKGLLMWITDAGNSTAVGDTLTSGSTTGTKMAVLRCTGAAWKVTEVY